MCNYFTFFEICIIIYQVKLLIMSDWISWIDRQSNLVWDNTLYQNSILLVDIENKTSIIQYVWDDWKSYEKNLKNNLCKEELRLVESREEKWLLLVWITDDSWLVPKYVTKSLLIDDWNLEIIPRFHNMREFLVFVRLSWVQLAQASEVTSSKVKTILQ